MSAAFLDCVALRDTMQLTNRPFPSSKKFHFQNEAKCEIFVVKMSFICIIIKNHFHINGFALSLALKVRFFGTRKWPIHLSCVASLTNGQQFSLVYILIDHSSRTIIERELIQLFQNFLWFKIKETLIYSSPCQLAC